MSDGDRKPAQERVDHSATAALNHLLAAIKQGTARIHFVTGQLASAPLLRVVEALAEELGFLYSIQVLPISVAALMSPQWIAPRLAVPDLATHLVLPGYCGGPLQPIAAVCERPLVIGPRDLRDLPGFLSGKTVENRFDDYRIEIIAEINGARHLESTDLMALAQDLTAAGADLIDLGCLPGERWDDVGATVRLLKSAGFRVSIDSFDGGEVRDAVDAGAELVLSVNSSNRHLAIDWQCEVVAIPDQPRDWDSLRSTVEFLADKAIPFRIDPILEPIGVGFAESLGRFLRARATWPQRPIMMGIGNLTELTDADSAAINLLLIGFCEELSIQSVLTTQVINWARTSVAECDWARRIAHHAVREGVPAKRLSDQLVLLRDATLMAYSPDELAALAEGIRDHHLRIHAQSGLIQVLSEGRKWQNADPFALFDELQDGLQRKLDPSHAFYLGYELAKAELALQLGKQYTQDESLKWGYLTRREPDRHRLRRRRQE